MEAPNIQLYNLLRQELHMADDKSLELMHVLDKEYKSGVREDLERFEKTMTAGFQRIDTRFDTVDKRLDNLDAHIVRLDNKIDTKVAELDTKIDRKIDSLEGKMDLKFSDLRGELRVEIHSSKVDIIKWAVSIFFALALMIIGLYIKK